MSARDHANPTTARRAAAVLTVCSLAAAALAGCGNGSRRPPSASADHTGRAAALRLASCLRRHGIAVLEPGPQGYDASHPVADDAAPRLFRRAASACGLPPLPTRAASAAPAGGSYPAGTRAITGTLAGAPYRLEVPRRWNRILILWSHGYETGRRPQATDPGALTTGWLLRHGYAIAASGYRRTGWAVAEARRDQIALLDRFVDRYGRPALTIAAGESLGGLISEGLAQWYPGRIAAALSLCGVSGGATGFWNQALDAELVIRTLLMPHSPLEPTRLEHPARDETLLVGAIGRAERTARGRARLALAAAVLDLPAWYSGPRPPTTPGAQATQLIEWLAQQLPQYAVQGRLDLERRAHGNPSWTVGVDWRSQLRRSVDRRLVRTLYQRAGLSLADDLRRLDAAPRISADLRAVAYLNANLTPSGALRTPVLTLHTTGDGVVPDENEQALARAVRRAGASRYLRQLSVDRAGHCSFTGAEQIVALQVLLERIRRGSWPDTNPGALNTAARNLGAAMNADDESDAYRTIHVAPSFIHDDSPTYLRPSIAPAR
jgi:hypothetical protein